MIRGQGFLKMINGAAKPAYRVSHLNSDSHDVCAGVISLESG